MANALLTGGLFGLGGLLTLLLTLTLRLGGTYVLDGPDPETDGLSSWTLPELCRVIEERFGEPVTHRAGG